MKTLTLLTAALATVVAGNDVAAQVRVQTSPRAFAYAIGNPDRAMIGVSTRSSGKRDTLGLLVESVTRDGPADQAGIEEGDRIASVNGVNLRLAPADAGEPDMDGIANRRLIRELEKRDAGDEVELQVYRDGATRTVQVKTIAAKELTQFTWTGDTFSALRRASEDRAVLGVSLGGTGSRRDTSGVLVVGVVGEGPAGKAGIEEGDRIAAINGVDLRVAREDAGDRQASRARINRLNREMEKVKAGDAVELRVYANGQARTVRVEAAKASEVPDGEAAFYFDDFTGALQRLKSMGVYPGASTLRLRPRVSTDLQDQPRLDAERRLRTIEALRSRVDAAMRLRLSDVLTRRTTIRRAAAG
ncbi:MAG TPA: PDZ domain-containing protein [Gemmatimonadaceae bacterium]